VRTWSSHSGTASRRDLAILVCKKKKVTLFHIQSKSKREWLKRLVGVRYQISADLRDERVAIQTQRDVTGDSAVRT
jgi:hypothetical protein